MENIAANPIHEHSIKNIQACRFFNLLQQTVQSTKHSLNAEDLKKFLNCIEPSNNINTVTFLHKIDKLGREMTEEYFGYCISASLENQYIVNDYDLYQFHQNLKLLLLGKYIKGYTKLQQWEVEKSYSIQQAAKYYENIKQVGRQLAPFLNHIQIGIFNSYLPKILLYMSIINLHPSLTQNAIIVYKNLLQGQFINTLQYTISMRVQKNQDMKQTLRCLCYLYSSLKYPEIYEKLEKTFLFEQGVLIYFMNNYNSLDITIKYLTSVLAALISKYIEKFPKMMWNSEDVLVFTCSKIGGLAQYQGLYYALQYLINLVLSYKNLDVQAKQNNLRIVNNMFTFAIITILKNSIDKQTKKQCLKLIFSIVDIVQLAQNQLVQLKKIVQIFDSNDIYLQIEAMKCLEIPIINGNPNVIKAFVYQNTFVNFLKKNSLNEHQKQQPHFFALEILYQLSLTEHIKFFFEKEMIESIFQLVLSRNGCVLSTVSRIVLNLIENSVDSQWKIAFLHEKFVLNCLSCLLDRCFIQDQFMLSYLPAGQQNFSYFNKICWINAWKGIYLLSEINDNAQHKIEKKLLFTKNFSSGFMADITKSLDIFFNTKNDKVIKNLLSQQIKKTKISSAKNQFTGKIVQLINCVFNNFSDILGDSQKDILKQIIFTKRLFYSKVYSLYNPSELEAYSIPIIFHLIVKYQDRQWNLRLPRMQWISIKMYISKLISKQKVDGIPIIDFRAVEMDSNSVILSESDYYGIINRSLKDYNNSKFMIKINVTNPTTSIQRNQFTERFAQKQAPNQSQSFRYNLNNHMNATQYDRYQSTRIPNNIRSFTPNLSRRGPEKFNLVAQRNQDQGSRLNSNSNLRRCKKCNSLTISIAHQLCTKCARGQ